jgi:hypothetical protein
MSSTLRLRVRGPVSIHGKNPNEEFTVSTDPDGVPIDLLWRKRLSDGGVECVTVATTLPPAPFTATPTKKKES